MRTPTTKNKLGNYLALTLGAGAAATSAKGATSVTFYGQGATPPAGINVRVSAGDGGSYLDFGSSNSSFFANNNYEVLFTRGSDIIATGAWKNGYFVRGDAELGYGAETGDSNYVNISLNGDDSIYEAVGQFHLDSDGYWLIALAKNDNGSSLSISAGKTAIDGGATSAVPEPSSHLALLALGSVGLLTRRRLKRAA